MAAITDTSVTLNWGPYGGRADATACLTRFTDRALGSDLGILWSDGQACMVLRAPTLNADGFGQSLIAEWIGPAAPPAPKPPPTLLERVKHAFVRAMELQGEAALAESEAYMAEGQAIAEWLGNKDHEHAVALAFDILGIVGFALLFVPGVGEVELGFMAAVRAGQILSAAGRVTALSAGVGASLGAYVDGRYLGVRYLSGGDVEARKAAAKEWDESPQAVTASLASALLAIPDFAVGSVLTLRSLRELPETLNATRAASAELRAQQAAKAAKAGQLEGRAAGSVPAWHARALEQKAARISSRAERLAARAEEAEARTRRLLNKLHAIMLVNVPGTAGVPTTLAYYARDNASDETEPFKTSAKYLRSLLEPIYCKKTHSGHNLSLRIGTVSRTPSTP